MKIAILISSLRCGGTEKTVSLLANAWAAAGDEVSILTLSGAEVPPFFSLHPQVRHCPLDLQAESANKFRGLLNNIKRIVSIRKALQRERPEVLVAFMEGTTALAVLASRGLGIPVVLSEVAVPALQSSGLLWGLMRKALYPFSQALVVPSQGVQRYFQQNLKLACTVIPNPVEEIPNPPGDRGEAHRLVAVGRLSPEKGFDTLLEVVASVRRAHPQVHLTIFGEGPLRQSLERQRESLGIQDAVSMPGTTANLAKEFHKFDIFVLSSRYEGFGNVLCEAMAAGLAVISFDCPTGPREIIRDGIDGMLVPPGDATALEQGLTLLLHDRPLRKRLSARAPEIAQRFGLATIAERWRGLFRPLVGVR